MDLTDEQWAVVEPLLPKPVMRADGKGRPRVDNRAILNGILGSCELALLGMICPNGIHHTKPAIGVSRNGSKQAHLRPFSKNWHRMSKNEAI